MERRALQRLLADIAEQRIDVIVVYKVDRLRPPSHGTITAAHLGGAATDLQRDAAFFHTLVNPYLAASPSAGALPTLRAATDPDAGNGSYWGPSDCSRCGDRRPWPPCRVGRGTCPWPDAFEETLTGVQVALGRT